ncbi:MAG: sugar phosphate isomerase/epimerase [Flavobacteriaceae bacterium]|nr:sugar phosphate isomerase/epimerase [Flavobacteriaceae bacterium]
MKIHNTSKFLAFFFMLGLLIAMSCKQEKKPEEQTQVVPEEQLKEPFFKLSLAQWSVHNSIRKDGMNPYQFAEYAKNLGFDGVEYVTQLYEEFYDNAKPIDGPRDEIFKNWIKRIKEATDKTGITNVLIMIDDEGDLADPDDEKRLVAVENHKKWVDAASEIGCHSVRVNTFGTNDPEEWKVTVADGLKRLSEYAATKNINVLVENHGWLSSNPPLVMEMLDSLDMDNCGTLPDFGNWCIRRPKSSRWTGCAEEYPDRYDGVKRMMSRAKAVSAKANEFNAEGDETKTNYYRMLRIIEEAGYSGHIGVEYEGSIPEKEGILATKRLLIKAAQQLN